MSNETSKATNRPWRMDHAGNIRGDAGEIVAMLYNEPVTGSVGLTNGELIVKAVNSHDDLLDLAAGLIALVEAFAPDMPYHNGLIDAAKARLAKVQP